MPGGRRQKMLQRKRLKRSRRAPHHASSQSTHTTNTSINDQNDPLAMSPLRKHKTRIQLYPPVQSPRRKTVERPHFPIATQRTTRLRAPEDRAERAMEVMDNGDLVPPSSEEEFEEWLAWKESSQRSESSRPASGVGMTPSGDQVEDEILSEHPTQTSRTMSRSSSRSLSATPPAGSLPFLMSSGTSMTIPLSFTSGAAEDRIWSRDGDDDAEGSTTYGVRTKRIVKMKRPLWEPNSGESVAPSDDIGALVDEARASFDEVYQLGSPLPSQFSEAPGWSSQPYQPRQRLSQIMEGKSQAPISQHAPSESASPVSRGYTSPARRIFETPRASTPLLTKHPTLNPPADDVHTDIPDPPEIANVIQDDIDMVPVDDLPASNSAPAAVPDPPPRPPNENTRQLSPPVDAALAQFRTARTFRNRTTLQIQPYTREKQIYEAALRRGGLKKGKHAIARPREIGSDEEEGEDEAQQQSSSEAAPDEDQERIVIGNTPPEGPAKAPRAPVPVIDVDYDDYFLQYGEVADEEDEIAATRLQELARARLRAAKEDRRKKRRAEQERQKFQQLMRDAAVGDDEDTSDDSEVRPVPAPRHHKTTSHTPAGKPKTYGRDKQITRRPASTSPEPTSNGFHASPSFPVVTRWSPSPDSVRDAPITSLRTPLSPLADNDADPGMAFPAEEFFYVNDVPHSSPKAHQAAESDASPSDSPESVLDPRAKIARRMLPAAMLRRLEQDAASRARRQAEKRKRGLELPARPGRAVARRGDGRVDLSGFLNEVGSDEDDTLHNGSPRTPSSRTPHREQQQRLIVISDDSDSDHSQALEDNGPHESLARLYDGDFESIVVGRRPPQRHFQRMTGRRPAPQSRFRRPPLGLVKRLQRPLAEANKHMTQSRLEFPLQAKSPRTKRTAKRSSDRRPQHKPRPAIQLDEHVIFATEDFAFSDDDPDPQLRPPRQFQRTISKAMSEPDILDNGIGKAKSWANFDRFPVDFGVSPLPSGIFCSPDSVIGSGQVAHLARVLCGDGSGSEVVPPSSAYGVDLRWDMPPAAVLAVIDIIFAGLQEDATALVNEQATDRLDLAPLNSLGCYITAKLTSSEEDMNQLRMACKQGLLSLSTSLDEVSYSAVKPSRPVRSKLLNTRWHLLVLAVRLCATGGGVTTDQASCVKTCAVGLIRQLLSFGFDRTIRPLKQVMRGLAESAEIDDLSTIMWIATIHLLSAWDSTEKSQDTFLEVLSTALDSAFNLDQVGPIAAERIWFLVFGLCALSQFDINGKITEAFTPVPRWTLVRRAIGLIKIAHSEEAEEKAQVDQLRGRDRYIRTMMARCVRLSAVWKWSFDRESFTVASRDLGMIFKNRQHRNFPTESPVDYPNWIASFDISLTAQEDTSRESAFELYLRLVCVAASDIIAGAESLPDAQQAEKDVQRLIMSIIPVSSVKFCRILPPTPRQLGQLINRYSTMVAACYFAPSLLNWLLANCRKWAPFEQADFDSRQISIRGLMYLAAACRHHQQPLSPVITRLADILFSLQKELDAFGKPDAPTRGPSSVEIERTMVLAVSCFKQVILRHSYDVAEQAKPVYPDPCLLHESWTARVFALDLANDWKCGSEVVATVQAFLDTRTSALPRLARQRRQEREARIESQDEFSLGIDFSAVDLAALGGDGAGKEDPIEKLDNDFAEIITSVLSPKIYRLLSDMLPPVDDETISDNQRAERQIFISKLTKCWSDCAGVVVVERSSPDAWTPYIGPFGKQSWQRLRNEQGRAQVGLHFMLNVAKLDPGAFIHHEEDFIALLFQTIVTDKLTVEHKYLSAVLQTPEALDHPLLCLLKQVPVAKHDLDRGQFLESRGVILEAIFETIPDILGSNTTNPSLKSFTYRCINLLVSSLVSNEKAIPNNKVIHRESYRAFTYTTIRSLCRLAGKYITPMSVPGLKNFVT